MTSVPSKGPEWMGTGEGAGTAYRDLDLRFLLFLSSGQPGATTMSRQASSLCLAPMCP